MLATGKRYGVTTIVCGESLVALHGGASVHATGIGEQANLVFVLDRCKYIGLVIKAWVQNYDVEDIFKLRDSFN